MKYCPNCGLLFPKSLASCPLDNSGLSDRTDPFEGIILGGKFRIIERIGMGGMGYVYRGQHVHMDRDVAIKILPVEATGSVDMTEMKTRFVREARAADLVRHENIVEIYEIGESHRNISYIVMELLEGRTLEEVISGESIPLGFVVSVMRQVCSVLGPTHAMGIIHRDLKPENVFLIEKDGRSDFVKILDFGVAHLASEPGLTVAGQVLGTPEYMSPEQAKGEVPGPPADLYALGCMAYDMVAGHPPFHNANMMEIMRQQIVEPPPLLSARYPRIPSEFEHIVMRLLVKDPAERYADAFSVLRDLDQFMPPDERPSGVQPRDSKLSFGTGGPIEAQGQPSMPPPLIASWNGFIARYQGVTAAQDRQTVYEMGELTGQLESLVQMMEQICTVMEMAVEERRYEGRRIRHAIAKFAQRASLKRGQLRQRRARYEEMKLNVASHDRDIAIHLVNLMSFGAIEVGSPIDEPILAACEQLGERASHRRRSANQLLESREQAGALMEQIRETENQIQGLRERLEQVIASSVDSLSEQQVRIESLEQERARVEARLCSLAAKLV